MKYPSFFNSFFLSKRKIFFITADNKWSFYWEGKELSDVLIEKKFHIIIKPRPAKIKNQIIHFGDRYIFFSYSDSELIQLCKDNDVILTWFHGGPEDGEEFSTMIHRLIQLQDYIQIIHTSCSITKEILINSGIHPEKITIIPIAINLNQFKLGFNKKWDIRKKLNIPQDSIIIGNFQKDGDGWGDGLKPKLIKGPDIFLELIKRLSQNIPNLMILLTGPARGYVKKGLNEIGVPYIHHYLDNYFDIVPYYHAIDLYVITSRAEGGPKALAECWACGVPVISTKVGMCADLIINSENGLMGNVNDTDELYEAALKMINDMSLREKCVNQGLLSVTDLSWERIGNLYLQNLYLPLISNHKKT